MNVWAAILAGVAGLVLAKLLRHFLRDVSVRLVVVLTVVLTACIAVWLS